MIDSEQQKRIDRILKLLALAEGTSFEAEAATARAMAEALITKHNVNVSIDSGEGFVVRYYDPWGKKWLWERIIGEFVAWVAGCQFYSNGRPEEGGEYINFKFVGTASNTETALYILSQVHVQRQRAWTSYKLKGGTDSFGQFCFSFARGIEAKIDRLITRIQRDETKRAHLWFKKHNDVKIANPISGRGRSDAGRGAGNSASIYHVVK